MSHSITAKLNKAAREYQGTAGTTFFVDLGEKNYNFKTKANEYTNYSAALFAKDGQIDFYRSVLVEGAVIEVSGTGVIIEMPDNAQYKPKLMIQDAKLGFTFSPNGSQPAQQQPMQMAPPQQAPQMAPAYQAPVQQQQMAPPQQAPQMAPQQQVQSYGAKPQPQPANNSQKLDDDIPY